MADNVIINTGTAATIAAEDVGGTEYQRIKIVDGGAAGTLGVIATSAAPAAGSVGLVVRVAGTVGIAPTAMTVNTAATVAGASVVVGNLQTVDATAATSAAAGSIGLVVALKAGASISVNTAATIAGASVIAQVSGPVGITVSAILGTVISVSAIGTVQTVQTVQTILTVNSILTVVVVNSVSTIGSLGVLNSIATGTVQALDVARTQFVLVVSSTSPSNAGMLLFTAYVGSAQVANTAGVSLFAIPAGKNLRIINIQAVAAGSVSALVGAVQVVFATSAATVTVSAIGGRGPALAIAGATTQFSQFYAEPLNDIPATQTVGVGITLNTSCLLGGVQIAGYLFP